MADKNVLQKGFLMVQDELGNPVPFFPQIRMKDIILDDKTSTVVPFKVHSDLLIGNIKQSYLEYKDGRLEAYFDIPMDNSHGFFYVPLSHATRGSNLLSGASERYNVNPIYFKHPSATIDKSVAYTNPTCTRKRVYPNSNTYHLRPYIPYSSVASTQLSSVDYDNRNLNYGANASEVGWWTSSSSGSDNGAAYFYERKTAIAGAFRLPDYMKFDDIERISISVQCKGIKAKEFRGANTTFQYVTIDNYHGLYVQIVNHILPFGMLHIIDDNTLFPDGSAWIEAESMRDVSPQLTGIAPGINSGSYTLHVHVTGTRGE